MTKKEVVTLLDQEIRWCEAMLLTDKIVTMDFKKGFISGLRQAKIFITIPD